MKETDLIDRKSIKRYTLVCLSFLLSAPIISLIIIDVDIDLFFVFYLIYLSFVTILTSFIESKYLERNIHKIYIDKIINIMGKEEELPELISIYTFSNGTVMSFNKNRLHNIEFQAIISRDLRCEASYYIEGKNIPYYLFHKEKNKYLEKQFLKKKIGSF
jgi:hypothetical protein